MKLIICKNCDDVVRLIHTKWRKCECGQSGGQYNDDLMSATVGGNCEVIGIRNDWVSSGKQKRNDPELNQIIQGEYLGDVQIHRLISSEGPKLNMVINELDKDFNEITFKDRRKYTINVKGPNKSPKTIKVPINKSGPSFKPKNTLKEQHTTYMKKYKLNQRQVETLIENQINSFDWVKNVGAFTGGIYFIVDGNPKIDSSVGNDEFLRYVFMALPGTKGVVDLYNAFPGDPDDEDGDIWYEENDSLTKDEILDLDFKYHDGNVSEELAIELIEKNFWRPLNLRS